MKEKRILDAVDLSLKIRKSDYKNLMDSDLEARMGALQRKAVELKIPITIVFEGWGAAGKGRLTSELLQALDPRGVNVYSTQPPNEDERLRPFLWRFGIKTTERGRIGIFDRSWYSRFLVEDMDTIVGRMPMHKAYEEVNSFERQLVDDGHVIIKFFLHISQEEQSKRFKELEKNPMTAWRVTDYDWQKHRRYNTYREITEVMIARTHTECAPWHVVSCQDWRFATVQVFETIINRVSQRIQALRSNESPPPVNLEPVTESMLDTADLSLSLSREEYGEQRRRYQERIWELEHEVYRRRLSVAIVYEGWDAAGKGGNIKRLVRKMDPRGYEVIPIGVPNDVELAHHYLWRFWMKIPKAGHFAIFDRSWYGRVLVERVEGFATEAEWKRAYREINEFEEQLVNYGTRLFKFWIDIDKAEQLGRFEDRQATPTKQWKITDDDWRNREQWEQYREVVDEMLWRTNTPYAPWTIVESNNKLYARIKTMKTVVHLLEKYLIEH